MLKNEVVTVVVSGSDLVGFCEKVLEKIGVPADEAHIISENLVEADLRGVESHGVVRFPLYVSRIVDGGNNPKPEIKIIRETATTAVIDGDNGMGQIVGIRAMELAIKKASQGDCAFVAVRNSNHYGACAAFVEMAAKHDMIGFTFTAGAVNHMTPWGGAEAVLGNNPFAVGFPTDREFPIVLDMACSVAARGKIIVAAKDRTPIPIDWSTDGQGAPTTDPVEAMKGFMLPIAGPKGYALTMTVGLLGTMLSGAAFGRDVTHMYEETDKQQNVGHLFGVLPVSAFDDVEAYKARIGKAIDDMKGVTKAPGVTEIYVPGEREYYSLLEKRENGIRLSRSIVAELQEIGQTYDVQLAVRESGK
jgi:LDH2 family malate/lactate/ureidoglycolate dehydrogenase